MIFNIIQGDIKFECNLLTISSNNECQILSQHFLIYIHKVLSVSVKCLFTPGLNPPLLVIFGFFLCSCNVYK